MGYFLGMEWISVIYHEAVDITSKVTKFGYNVTCSLLDIIKASLVACGNTSVEMVILLSLSLISDEERQWARLYILLTVCAAGSVETIHQLVKSLPRETILSILEPQQQPKETNYEYIVRALKLGGRTTYLGIEQIDKLTRYWITVVVANNYRVPLTARLFYIVLLNLGLPSGLSFSLALIIGATSGITELMQSDLPAMINADYLNRIGHAINPKTFAMPDRAPLLRILYGAASLSNLSLLELTKIIDKAINNRHTNPTNTYPTTAHIRSVLNLIENKHSKIFLALGQATDATIGLNIALLLMEFVLPQLSPLTITIISSMTSVTLFTSTFVASYATNRVPTGKITNPERAGMYTLLGYLLNTTMIACPNQFFQTLISTFLAQQFIYTITTCAISGCTNEVPTYYGILTALTSAGLSMRDSLHVLGAGLEEAIKIYKVTHDKDPDEKLAIMQWLQRLLLLNDAKQQTKAPTTVVIKIEGGDGKEMTTYTQLNKKLLSKDPNAAESEEEYMESDKETGTTESSPPSSPSDPSYVKSEETSFEEDPENPLNQDYQPPPM